ncbi:MAG: radical SAM protein [Oscillospiraceae bacterium]
MEQENHLYEHDVVFRPPPEHNSILVEIAVGCTYSKCTYCACTIPGADPFHLIPMEKVERNIAILAAEPKNRTKDTVFFLGLNVFALSTERLLDRFALVFKYMPWVKHISMYARADDVLHKNRQQLEELKMSGLGDLYIGLESGSDKVLRLCQKGVTVAQMLEAFQTLDSLGIPYDLSSVVGLGGRELCWEHATQTAALYNQIHPKTIRIMALTVWPGTQMDEEIKAGRFTKLTPEEEVLEQRLLLGELTLDECVFIASHMSNSIPLSGLLQRDKEAMLDKMDELIYTFDLTKIQKKPLAPTAGW